jgi:hypothetical protein
MLDPPALDHGRERRYAMTRSIWLFGTRFIVYANYADAAGRYNLVEVRKRTDEHDHG